MRALLHRMNPFGENFWSAGLAWAAQGGGVQANTNCWDLRNYFPRKWRDREERRGNWKGERKNSSRKQSFQSLSLLFSLSGSLFVSFSSFLVGYTSRQNPFGSIQVGRKPQKCTPCTGLSKGRAAQNFAILPRFDHPMFTPLISMLTIAGDIQTRISSEVSIPNSRSVVHILGGNFSFPDIAYMWFTFILETLQHL